MVRHRRRLNAIRHYRFLRFTSRHWRMRLVFWGGALTVGLVSIVFATLATHAESLFHRVLFNPWVALIVTPVGFLISVFVARAVFPGSEGSGIPQAIAARRFRDPETRQKLLSLRLTFGKILLTLFGLACGASIGREAAPKLLGGASASVLAGWGGLSPQQRRLLVACAGGAGLAAVYNVPLAGALFTAEILIGSITLPVMLPAIACSWIATATAWIYLPHHATYIGIPDYRFTGSLMTWSLLAGPVIGLISAGYIRLIGWVSHHRARGTRALFAPVAAFGILGVIGIWYPQLFGNGLDMARDAFLGVGSLALLLALFALKPLVTAMCLASSASGGLFTPTLSTGAVLGGALGIAWNLAWPGSPSGAFAMVGAAAMIGAAMQAPLSGLALVLELTHSGFGLMVPMMAATLIATLVAFHVDGYSIYSARLPAYTADSAPADGRP